MVGYSGRVRDADGIDLCHNRDMGSRLGDRAGRQLEELFSDVQDDLETPTPWAVGAAPMMDRPVASRPGLTVRRRPGEALSYLGAERRTNRSRVLVLSDDLLVAEVLVSALMQNGFVARSGIPAAALDLQDTSAWRPDLVLLDTDVIEQRSAGLGLIGGLRRAGVGLVVLGRQTDVDRMGDDPLAAGAAVVVAKSSPLSHLVGTFCRLLRHEHANEGAVRCSMTGHQEEEPRSKTTRSNPLAVLTEREGSILVELMAGHRAEIIAANGYVSISTVRSHIKSILQKLGVNSQLAAVAFARQAGWSGDSPDQSVSNF
jgi:DNA-binding NarL/FixJ family response regulator